MEGVFNVEQPPQLILLRCYNCPDSSLAPNISTKNLKFLHIEGSNLETLWHLESQVGSHVIDWRKVVLIFLYY